MRFIVTDSLGNVTDASTSFTEADDLATKAIRFSGAAERLVYKLHKVYRPACAKEVPEIVYIDP